MTTASFSGPLLAQGTMFTYQGRLNDKGQPATGSYDLTFSLFNVSTGGSVVAGPIATNAFAISNGVFSVGLDFGSGIFNGTNYWLQISVRTNNGSSFIMLSPRRRLMPSPYAIFAEGANAAGLSGTIPPSVLNGTYGNPMTLSNTANSFSGNGSGLTSLKAANINAGTAGISISGNATTAGYATNAGYANNAGNATIATTLQGADTNAINVRATNAAVAVVAKNSANTNALFHFSGGLIISNNISVIYPTVTIGLTTKSRHWNDGGGIITGGYLTVSGNPTGAYLPYNGHSMIIMCPDVPNGFNIYGQGNSMIPIEYFEQVDGGKATNNDWPRGRDMFMLGSMGQIRLNNPVSQITNYFPSSGLEFDGAQLVFQQEQFLAGGHGAMGPTNYWGISQVSNLLAIGPIKSPTIVTNPQGIIARVDGPVTRSIVISTNGNVGIGGSALNVLTNGKVGIGTNNPTVKLQVIGNILASGTITGSSDRNLKENFAPVNPSQDSEQGGRFARQPVELQSGSQGNASRPDGAGFLCRIPGRHGQQAYQHGGRRRCGVGSDQGIGPKARRNPG